MHQQAQEADLIIVNHHLFFADLAVKDRERGAIIPDYAAVIFDEAHEIEDVAGQYFGVSISSAQIEDLARDIASLSHRKNFGSNELDRALITLGDRSAMFFALFGGAEGRTAFRNHEAFLEQHEEKYRDVLYALEIVAVHLELIRAAPEEAIPLLARCRDLVARLEFWMEGGLAPAVPAEPRVKVDGHIASDNPLTDSTESGPIESGNTPESPDRSTASATTATFIGRKSADAGPSCKPRRSRSPGSWMTACLTSPIP